MVVLSDKTKCTGCTACLAVCPLDCISMRVDIEGFLYPDVDNSKCVSCGACEKVCPVLYQTAKEQAVPQAYGIRAKDMELRLKSSSGGIFTLLAERILEDGGAVFGVSMSPDCKSAHHIMVETPAALAALRGSKYIQSSLDDTFRTVRTELENGRKVLFTGTPCQADGLKNFLGREYDNLLCVEIICHGVPSPALWREYVEYLEKKTGAPIVKAEFRHKKLGWKLFGARLENSKRRVLYSTLRNDPYILMFLKNQCLRPSCYQCHSKGLTRNADLTVGDFWGIQNVAPELDDDKGTSLVLVHTEKGNRALRAILEETEYQEVDCMAALKDNPAMLRSVGRPAARDSFFVDMGAMNFKALQKKYIVISGKDRLKYVLERTKLLPLTYRLVYRIRKRGV